MKRLLILIVLILVIPIKAHSQGWITNPANGHFYQSIDCGNWLECEQAAVAQGAHLVTINDANEQNWIFDTFYADGCPAQYIRYWIGFTDSRQEGTWEWISDEPVTYTHWYPGEPNNFAACTGGEDYAEMDCNGWNDLGPSCWAPVTKAIIEKTDTMPPVTTTTTTVSTSAWEMYVSNESSNSITVHDQAGGLIKTITDPLIVYTIQLAFRGNGILYVASLSGSKVIKIDQNDNIVGYIQTSNVVMGLAIGNNNHLYVGVSGLIEEYDENDNFIKSFNGGLTSIKPCAMTIGPNGNLFTVDNNNDRVIEFSLNGNIVNQFSTGARSYPRGIAFGPDGFIYVAGDGMNNVSVFDPNTFALTRTITGVTAPYGINFDPENHHLFVANFGANNILEYLYTGEFIGIFASGLSRPNHIAFKSSGTVSTTTTTTVSTSAWEMYVSNEYSNVITVYNQQGVLIDTISSPLIQGPRQLSFRVDGNLYVASGGTSKIVIINKNNQVIGSFNCGPIPTGLAFGGNNHLYVGIEGGGVFIEEYDENNNFVKSFKGGLSEFKPNAMNIGPNGDLYVIGFGLHEFDLNGNLIKTVDVPGCLRGVDFGQDGLIYVARNCINDIGVLNPDNFQVARTITGPIAPYGITFDPINRHLFVADFGPGNILEYLYTGEFIGVFASGLSGPNHIAFKSLGTSTTTVPVTSTTTTVPPSGYVPPDNRPYVQITGSNINCPIGADSGGFSQGIDIQDLSTIPDYITYTGIIRINPGYCFVQPDTMNWCFTCYDLYIGGAGVWLNNVTDGQTITFQVPKSSLNLDTPNCTTDPYAQFNMIDVGFTFYECSNHGRYANPPQGLNINKCCPARGCCVSTAIALSSFTAQPGKKIVTLNWTTETETNNAGFNLYRAETEDGEYVKINSTVIPAQGSSTQGTSYEFVDTDVKNRKTYYYKLEDIDLNGGTTMHGPVSAMPRLFYRRGK